MESREVIKEIKKLGNKEKAKILSRFFKTGKGDYAEGDIFLGVTVPVLRKISKKFEHLSLKELSNLISNKFHECRFVALQILIIKFYSCRKNNDAIGEREVFDFYIKNRRFINNWDLVDTSSPHVVGMYLLGRSKDILYKLARSENLWDERIAILATFSFLRNNDFKDALKIYKMLLCHKHHLIHKAIGWMLRELGKRSLKTEEKFLKDNLKTIPRITLSYAMEKFSPEKKKIFRIKSLK